MLLLIYAVVVGMLVPLKPGIIAVDNTSISSGMLQTITAETYGAEYAREAKLLRPQVYLKRDSAHYLTASEVQVSGRKVSASFDIPMASQNSPKFQSLTLLITDEKNGTLVYPSGIQLRNKPSVLGQGWAASDVPKIYKKKGFYFPYRNILVETIRNVYYHVSLWFAMFALFFAAVICSILYLVKKDIDYDRKASALTYSGLLMGILGIITGSIWAKATWGAYWTSDVKLNMSAISLMIYMAYWILRSSMDDVDKKARITSAYSIFAFVTIVPLIFVLPRMTDSLHPGNGGNPALGGEDMDNTMRMIFYPAVIGFILLGVWMSELILRYKRVKEKIYFKLMS